MEQASTQNVGREQGGDAPPARTQPSRHDPAPDKPPAGPGHNGAPAPRGEEASSVERLWFDDTAAHEAPGAKTLTIEGPLVLPQLGWDNRRGAGSNVSAALPAGPEIDALFAPPPLPDIDSAPAESQARALVRVCEPLFQRVCRLNRLRRAGFPDGRPRPKEVRNYFEQILDAISTATVPPELSKPLASLELPLRCFVDLIVARGGFGFNGSWVPLEPGAAGRPEQVLLDATAEALADATPAAVEQLEVLHACLCLTADLLQPAPAQPAPGQPVLDQPLNDQPLNDQPRIDQALTAQTPLALLMERAGSRLTIPDDLHFCPKAYEGVFTRVVLAPVGQRLRLLAGVSAALLLLAIAGAVALNWYYCRQLDGSINSVRSAIDNAPGPAGR